MTGSLFLLAVAVIVLPMLLDGAGVPARALPDMPMEATLPEVQPLASQEPASDYLARVQRLRDQVDDQGFLTDSGTRFGEPVLTSPESPGSVGAPGDGASPGRASSEETRAPAARGAAGAGPASAEQVGQAEAAGGGGAGESAGGTTDGARAWAVQVASFARAANAEDFRGRLRKDGYEAFISTARVSGRVLSRVAVGPLLDHGRAETLRGELASRYKVRARLMAFSN